MILSALQSIHFGGFDFEHLQMRIDFHFHINVCSLFSPLFLQLLLRCHSLYHRYLKIHVFLFTFVFSMNCIHIECDLKSVYWRQVEMSFVSNRRFRFSFLSFLHWQINKSLFDVENVADDQLPALNEKKKN